DRSQHIQKEPDAFGRRQAPLVAKAVDRLPLHMLQHQVRPAAGNKSCVENACDVGVSELAEHPTLASEVLNTGAAEQREMQQLDAHAAVEAAVVASGKPHAAHAATA